MKDGYVVFSSHAITRLKQRFDVSMSPNREYYIADGFTKCNYPYLHHNTNLLVENWYNTKEKIILVVGCRSRVVVTIMADGYIFDNAIEFEKKMEEKYA